MTQPKPLFIPLRSEYFERPSPLETISPPLEDS